VENLAIYFDFPGNRVSQLELKATTPSTKKSEVRVNLTIIKRRRR
jgi:hypothetical protein